MSNLISIAAKSKSILSLTWCINNICTQHCRYCPSMLNMGKNHHYEWHHAERFAQRLLDSHKEIYLSISGGEPTVSPWLKDLINMFTARGHTVGLTSNGVRRGHYWDDCEPSYICLSYHAAYDDGHWVERAIETSQRIKKTSVRIMMDPLHWDRCNQVYWQIYSKTNMGIEAVRIVDWGSGSQIVSYTEEQLEHIAQLTARPAPDNGTLIPPSRATYFDGTVVDAGGIWANELASSGDNVFTGWQCDIGLESLFVQFDGSYKRGNCDQGGYLGWIQDLHMNKPARPVICEQSSCRCTTDILISKRIIPLHPAHSDI